MRWSQVQDSNLNRKKNVAAINLIDMLILFSYYSQELNCKERNIMP